MQNHVPVPCSTFLFDLDGTLIDSKADIAFSLNRALARLNIPSMPDQQIADFVGDGVQTLIRRCLQHACGADPDETLRRRALDIYLEEYGLHLLDSTRLQDGVLECLSGLSWGALAVITNKPERFSRKILKGLGLGDSFRLILGGDSTMSRKPDPGPLLDAIRILGARPLETAMVGDSEVDVIAGKAAGVITCGVTGGYRGREELASAGCDLIMDSLADLPRYFYNPRQGYLLGK